MQQLSFLDPPPRDGAAPVWEALDNEQRTRLVLRLARLRPSNRYSRRPRQ